MDMWNAPMVQSRQSLTYRLMENVGLGGIAESGSSAIDPHDRHTWRSGARSAMRAASQIPGRGPTDVDVAPVPTTCMLIKHPMMIMVMMMLNSAEHEIFSAHKYENDNNSWHFHIYQQINFHVQLCLARKNLQLIVI